MYLPISVAEKEERIALGIEIENRSWIPVAQVQAKIQIQNLFYMPAEEIKLQGMADGRKIKQKKGKTRLTVEVDSSSCGPIRVALQEVWVYDLFRMFKKKIPVSGEERLVVMPELYRAPVLLTERTRDFLVESEEYDKKKSGDDPAEVFQIREYRGGDRLQSVHWKLSARTEELMVKEYSLPVGCAVLFFLDMEYRPEEMYGWLDEFLEAALAISQGLLEVGADHFVVWYDKNTRDIKRLKMQEKEDVYILIEQLFYAGPYAETVHLEELYGEKYRGEIWHTYLKLYLDMKLETKEKLLMELKGTAREVLENGELMI